MNRPVITASDPYDRIRKWWGEELTSGLMQRMVDAPKRQFGEFLESAIQTEACALDQTPPGRIRPALKFSTADAFRGRGGFHYLESALLMLLYVEEIALEDPLPRLAGPPTRVGVLTSLLRLKPLYDAGAIRFFQFHPKLSHPSRTLWSVRDFVESLSDNDPISVEIDRLTALPRGYDLDKLIFMSRVQVGLSLGLSAAAPGSLNLLSSSAEEDLYNSIAIRQAMATATDLRSLRLTALSSVAVPTFRSESLATVRSNSDEFQQWRQTIGRALQRISSISDDDAEWQSEARGVMQDEIAPIRQHLAREVSKSPALETMKSGVATLAYSGIGALTGGLAGGQLGSAIAGAAGAKGLELGVNYLRAIRRQHRDKAMLDLALAFYE